MAGSTNSGRTLLKATYVPVNNLTAPKPGAGGGGTPPPESPNVMLKVAYLRGLNIRPAEMAILHDSPKVKELQLEGVPETKLRSAVKGQPLIDVAKSITTDLSPNLMVTHAALLAKTSMKDLEALGRELHAVRQQKVKHVAETLASIVGTYSEVKARFRN